MNSTSALAWHYTTEDRVEPIMQSGAIEPAISGVPAHERPIVWFSRNAVWEPTANKGLVDIESGIQRTATLKEMKSMFGLFRFGARSDDLLRWPDLVRAAGIRTATARRLERVGRLCGALPSDWQGQVGRVTLDRIVTMERMVDGKWQPAEGAISIAPLRSEVSV